MKNKIKYKKNRQQGVFSFSLKTFKTPRLEKYKLNTNKIKINYEKIRQQGVFKIFKNISKHQGYKNKKKYKLIN